MEKLCSRGNPQEAPEFIPGRMSEEECHGWYEMDE